jgi:hypothetical protein
MKFRITPLNFATAFFVVLAAYIWIYGASITGKPYERWGGTIATIFFFFALVVAFLDLIFRNFFKVTKTLWTVELSFIVLVVVIFLLVK